MACGEDAAAWPEGAWMTADGMAKVVIPDQGGHPGRSVGADPGLALDRIPDAQMRQHARPDIGEALPPPDGAWLQARSEAQDRRVLAGMVGTAPGGVVAVVGSDDD